MDRLSGLLGQLRDFFMALPPARRMTFVAMTAGIIIGTGALAWWVQQPQYRVLYSGLGASDAGAVIEYLKTEKIPYRVSDNGGNIEVAASRMYETRMALAGRGIPQGGGVGFEIFDKQTLGMTDFVQRLNYQRALQGELARSISELDTVEAARVHLAMPERSLFVAEERRPSASVVLKLKPGRSLAPEQISGVVHLVAASVEGLRPADVTVVDVNGQVLSHDQSEQDAHHPGQGMMTFQREMEQGYTEGIESMLTRVLGPVVDAGKDIFESSFLHQDSLIRNYEVIGEIAKRLPESLLQSAPSVKWTALKGFRDFLAHNYDRVDLNVVWDAVAQLPTLREAIQTMLNNLPEETNDTDNGASPT